MSIRWKNRVTCMEMSLILIWRNGVNGWLPLNCCCRLLDSLGIFIFVSYSRYLRCDLSELVLRFSVTSLGTLQPRSFPPLTLVLYIQSRGKNWVRIAIFHHQSAHLPNHILLTVNVDFTRSKSWETNWVRVATFHYQSRCSPARILPTVNVEFIRSKSWEKLCGSRDFLL